VTELSERLQAALGDRYRLERELGRGGTAVVFLAYDPKHDRRVAIKVLLPELALAIGAERFLREITIAAKLTHPHILPLHDSGEAGGFLYYVMPYVEGESLRHRLNREKQLPIDDVIRIAGEVASALDRAHRQGVVHRDIKPENILLEGGYAIVADFGIARAMSAASEGQPITQTGMAVGTPVYMSPEQGAGSRHVDARADLYSLACVVYEMLAGHPPFQGTSVQELFARHAVDPVPSLRAARRSVPESLEQAVVKALAKEPVDRFATAAEFAAALNAPRLTPAGVAAEGEGGTLPASPAAGLTAVATPPPVSLPGERVHTGGVSTPLVTTPTGRAPIDSLAVLPFSNMSGDPDSEYLCDGITESVINNLSRLEVLRVVPRSVVFRYRGSDVDPAAVAREVHARAVVTGRILQRGDVLIVKAELVDAANESQLWGEQYNRRIADIFAVQEEMAGEITRALRLRLTGEQKKELSKRYTDSAEAYQAYLRGRYHWNKRTVEGLRQALSHFQRAIDLDPNYALAYTGLADSFNILGYYNNVPPRDAYPKGKAAAARALTIDETLAEAHASLGYVSVFYDWDWPEAERNFLRALELSPKYATTHHWYAWYLFAMQRFDEALAEMRRAQELDPLSLIINDHLGYALLLAGRREEALEQLQKTRDLDPTFPWTYWRLGSVYLDQGRYEDAIAAFQTVVDKTDGGVGLGYVGLACAMAGRAADARAVLTRLEELSKQRYVSPLESALVWAGLGENEQAFASLEQAYHDRVSDFARVKLLPWPAPVRADPRFGDLVRRIGLAP
jgi:serine/threonine-protein kinase